MKTSALRGRLRPSWGAQLSAGKDSRGDDEPLARLLTGLRPSSAEFVTRVQQTSPPVVAVLNTHYHMDHVGGVPNVAAILPVGTFVDHGESVEREGDQESDALDARVAIETGLKAGTVRNVRTKLSDNGFVKAYPERDEFGSIAQWKIGRTAAPRP